MFERFNDADLARKEFLEEIFGNVALRDDLDGDVRIVALRVRQLHVGKRSVSELFQNAVALLFQYRMTVVVPGSGERDFRGARHEPRRPLIYGCLSATILHSRRHLIVVLRDVRASVKFRSAVAPRFR